MMFLHGYATISFRATVIPISKICSLLHQAITELYIFFAK